MLTFVLLSSLALVAAQEQWTACNSYCFPRDAQSSADLEVAAGQCPPGEVFLSYSQTYYTDTCTCYDYQITDGSFWSNCYTCGDSVGNYEQTCLATQPQPQAPASCSSKSDDISTACNDGSDVTKAVNFLCDLDQGLNSKSKGIFATLKLFEPPLAKAALTAVNVGCSLWNKDGKQAMSMVKSGCTAWNVIGGCPAVDATTNGGSSSSSSSSSSGAASTVMAPATWALFIVAASMAVSL